MPEDRLFHKRLGHSRKVMQLTDAEEIAWRTYVLAADDFGVLRFDALSLQAAHERLADRSRKVVQRMFERVRDVGLVHVFEHQDQLYCCQLDWQDYQKVRYPLRTANPRPSGQLIVQCTRATRWLFTVWPGGKGKLPTWLPPDEWSPDEGSSSGNLPGLFPENSGRSRASAGGRGPDPDPDPDPVQVPDPGTQPRSQPQTQNDPAFSKVVHLCPR